jgi:hypothetical protein
MCSDQGAPIKTKAVKVSLLPDTDPGEAFAKRHASGTTYSTA